MLYEHCQNLPLYVSRREIQVKATEITGCPSVRTFWNKSIEIENLRGSFISAGSKSHLFVETFGNDVIVLSDKLKENQCWQRFIYTKELMHLFDSDEDSTGDEQDFEKLLYDLSTPFPQEISRQTKSDYNGFWMALACLCPEKTRLEMQDKRNKNQVTDYDIAVSLKIPELYVQRLFEDRYTRIVQDLISC